ncbi:hypothetical protein [Kutzneria sp. NPDC052558]|uniref:nSTAND1 domain-containing NTPase n=1 Tax=Kutzneria sp. NPDC052558 TaxID=3364121 RepID=UPI0037CCB707
MPRPERPLDPTHGAVGAFAADLRRLRERAGRPTYRELSQAAHYSPTVLSQAAAGRKPPTLAVTLAYVTACGGDPEHWRARWHELTAQIGGDIDNRDPGCAPYLGLAPFEPDDADRFFGRDELLDDLVTRVSQRRLVGVFGASGSGKSSLVRAGLVAMARKQGLIATGPTLLLTPGPHPIEELAVHLAAASGLSSVELRAELAAAPDNLRLRVRQALHDEPDDVDLLVVVDQFEEVFTLCHDPDERAGFIAALVAATSAPGSRVRVVLGVRADFYGHCLRHPELVAALRDAQVPVGPLSPEQLREAIIQPAVHAGLTVESALVSRLIADAAGQPAVLPLVSHALMETWRRRRGTRLTVAGYEETGGLHQAIAHTAEQVHTALDATQREIVRGLFLRLTAFGEGTEDTKRRVARTELDADPDTAVVLEKLTSARLLTADRDSVQITHEALIRCWPRLRGWLACDRDRLRAHRELTEATNAWELVHRDPGALYRGARLAVARDRLGAHDTTLTAREREFLETSLAAEAAEQASERRRSRRSRQLTALLAVLLVLAVIATGIAVRSQYAIAQERNAAIAGKAALDAAALRESNPALSIQLSLAAYRLSPTPGTRDGLLSALATPYAARITVHTDTVEAVSYSDDGRLLASASADKTVRIWDVSTPLRPSAVATISGDAAVRGVRFAPGGRIMATADAGSTPRVRLWDMSKPQQPRQLATLPVDAGMAAFSGDGRLLATGSADSVRLWDLTDPSTPRAVGAVPITSGRVRAIDLSPHGPLLAVAGPGDGSGLWNIADPAHPVSLSTVHGRVRAVFSPDGRVLATTDDRDSTPRLWDISDPGAPQRAAVLVGHTASVNTLRFAPDGHGLATSGDDNTIRLWDTTDPRQPHLAASLTGHTNTVYALAFSPDGRTLASGAGDTTVRLADLSGLFLADHADTVVAAAFSADGRMSATASMDHTVRLADTTDPRDPRPLAIIDHPDAVFTAAFSPDGHLLAVSGRDHTVRLWDITEPRRPRPAGVVTGHADAVCQAVFSPDGRLLATASWDHTARLWDITTAASPRLVGILTGQTDVISDVAFTPDGHRLATASQDVRLWDITDPVRPQLLAAVGGDNITRVAIGAGGHLLATASQDHTVRLWDISDPRHTRGVAVITAHTDSVDAVAFSPDGRRLATAGEDRAIRLFDITDPTRPQDAGVLAGHTATVARAVFSPDGHTLLTAGADHSARLWETDIDALAARVCALARPAITPAEWDRHFPELPYQPPC